MSVDDETNTIITTVSTTLSLLGCLLIFILHTVWGENGSNARKILLYITVADFITALGYLVGLRDKSNHQVCVVQSFLTTMSSLISFFWTCCMALYLHAVCVNGNFELGKKIMLAFHCLGWPIPFLISLTALLENVLGESDVATGGWCWIKFSLSPNCTECLGHSEAMLWMLITGKFWEIASYLTIIIAYARLWKYVRLQRQQVKDDASSTVTRFRSVERRMIMIPVVFIIIRIWGTIRFFSFAAYYDPDGLLEYLQAFGDGSQGFFNAVMFCLMTHKALKFFPRFCPRKKDGLLKNSIQIPQKSYGGVTLV